MVSQLAARFASILVILYASAGIPAADPVSIPDTDQFDLRSKSGQEYRIFVAPPAGPPPASGWPVIYLSDGNGNFPVLRAAVQRQTMGGSPAVVVGIGYPNHDAKNHGERRTYDLTPATSPEWLKLLPKGPPLGKTGGQDEFLAFIEDELKAQVQKKYRIDPKRQTLFGHSFGGLFVLHVLFTKPDSFQTYLASSPSIWWNDCSVFQDENQFVKKYAGKDVPARLLITVGQWEEKPAPNVSVQRAGMLKDRRMVSNAKELSERLTSSGVKNLKIAFREFAEEDHGSVVLPAASRGVRFALETP